MQEADDLVTRGETLEQYDSYQKYCAELEKHFDGFAASEGFGSARECFDTIQSAVAEDVIRQKKHMEALEEQLKQFQASWAERQVAAEDKAGNSAAEGKDAEDQAEGKDGGAESKSGGGGRQAAEPDGPPLLLFCQPISLESLVQSMLSISEYQTFSMIMRMKVQQHKILREMEAQAQRLIEDAERRKEDLELRRDCDDRGHFGALRDRINALTPNRQDLVQQVPPSAPPALGAIGDTLWEGGSPEPCHPCLGYTPWSAARVSLAS